MRSANAGDAIAMIRFGQPCGGDGNGRCIE
jgi:hypothetical protein